MATSKRERHRSRDAGSRKEATELPRIKKSWSTPKLIRYGTLKEITRKLPLCSGDPCSTGGPIC